MESFLIFIVEDDPMYGEILAYHLSLNPDYEICRYTSARECIANLHRRPSLVTIDLSLPDMTGSKLFEKIRETDDSIPVIAISAQQEISVAVELLRKGVTDYFVKDDSTKDQLWNAVIRIRETRKLKHEVAQLKEELGRKFSFEKTVKGQSDAIRNVFVWMAKSAGSSINVSITGETGTGKEVVAKAIHYNSERAKKPFVPVNMAAIPADLMESELFGHEKGAFTGAIARKIGRFEEANGGTLFLDEIAELDLNLQSKLLRALQEREITRVGGSETIKFNARLICATHKNLSEEVNAGNFREDLFYRVIGLPIELPPLRERGNDILLLAKHFVEESCRDNQRPVLLLTEAARKKLETYPFPGNVRELRSVIELAVVMSSGNEIREDDIRFNSVRSDEIFMVQEKTLRQYTQDIIRFFLQKHNGDVLKTARKLDIGKSTIYKMLQEKEIVI